MLLPLLNILYTETGIISIPGEWMAPTGLAIHIPERIKSIQLCLVDMMATKARYRNSILQFEKRTNLKYLRWASIIALKDPKNSYFFLASTFIRAVT